jgi:hypothetical protein
MAGARSSAASTTAAGKDMGVASPSAAAQYVALALAALGQQRDMTHASTATAHAAATAAADILLPKYDRARRARIECRRRPE